jgi:hypothetical protein
MTSSDEFAAASLFCDKSGTYSESSLRRHDPCVKFAWGIGESAQNNLGSFRGWTMNRTMWALLFGIVTAGLLSQEVQGQSYSAGPAPIVGDIQTLCVEQYPAPQTRTDVGLATAECYESCGQPWKHNSSLVSTPTK